MKTERKPRRNIQYKDLGQLLSTADSILLILRTFIASAVARFDNLEFLTDVIPRTIPYKKYREKKTREAAQAADIELGQTTLDGRRLGDTEPSGDINSDGDNVDGANGESVQSRIAALDVEIRGPRTNGQYESNNDAGTATFG